MATDMMICFSGAFASSVFVRGYSVFIIFKPYGLAVVAVPAAQAYRLEKEALQTARITL
jgi:hypothetical protein